MRGKERALWLIGCRADGNKSNTVSFGWRLARSRIGPRTFQDWLATKGFVRRRDRSLAVRLLGSGLGFEYG